VAGPEEATKEAQLMRPAGDPIGEPDLRGRVALVTGASGGLGLVTARRLAGFGARTLLGCRDAGRAERARGLILARHPAASVESVRLDLASLEAVADAAAEIADRAGRLDLLVNNAGIMAPARAAAHVPTADGFEPQLGVNHLGHFALTGRLLPLLLASGSARVVTVSSFAHYAATGGGLTDPADFKTPPHGSTWLGYARSKLANLLFALELERRAAASHAALGAEGASAGGQGIAEPARRLISIAVHPGLAGTDLVANAGVGGRRFIGAAARFSTNLTAQSAEAGALPTLYAATSREAVGGEFYGPRLITRGAPARNIPSRAARDRKLAALLWAASVEATGVGYEELPSFRTPL
jgi:NAD(P)-dependent dehydrogenase (short-subunit alcohol dehydrogenase family)